MVDSKKKEDLISSDPKCSEILIPLLRGRDVQKYYPDFQNLWLIATLPSKKYNINDFPSVRDYLMSFGKQLEQSGEKGSRKKTTNKWFETQDNIAYWEDFEKPKIIYPNMTKFFPFTYDENDHFYHNDKSFHIVGKRLFWLVAFLNSKLFKYCFKDNFPELLGGTRELRKVFVEQIPVKQISEDEEKPFENLVRKIIELKKEDQYTTELEREIDQMVYKIYGLTNEEIQLVENSLN